MGTEIFCFANGDVEVLFCIPILPGIGFARLQGKRSSSWHLIKTQGEAAQHTRESPQHLPEPGKQPRTATSKCQMEKPPQGGHISVTMLKVCVGRLCSVWLWAGAPSRKGVGHGIMHISCRHSSSWLLCRSRSPIRAGEAKHVVALQLMPCRSCPYPKGAQSCSQGRAGDTDRPAVKVSRGATRGGKNMDTVTLWGCNGLEEGPVYNIYEQSADSSRAWRLALTER